MVPRISVLMPVYNCERYVGEAVESILAQTYSDFELIIVDDASTDDTPGILDRYTDPRIVRLRNDKNLGIPGTRNRCLATARGEFVAWMDADDRSHPERLSRQVALLTSHPELGAVGSWAALIDEHGHHTGRDWKNPSGPGTVRAILASRNCIVNGSTMARTERLRSVGGYRPIIAEDYDLWLRLTDSEACIDNLPMYLYEYRIHSSSDSQMRKLLYDVSAHILVIAARTRRAGKPDPLDGVTREQFEQLAQQALRGRGHWGRSWFASRHWHSACRAHAQGRRMEHLRELVTTLRWQPAYGPAWQALGNAVRRRLGLADLPPANSVSGGGGAAV